MIFFNRLWLLVAKPCQAAKYKEQSAKRFYWSFIVKSGY